MNKTGRINIWNRDLPGFFSPNAISPKPTHALVACRTVAPRENSGRQTVENISVSAKTCNSPRIKTCARFGLVYLSF